MKEVDILRKKDASHLRGGYEALHPLHFRVAVTCLSSAKECQTQLEIRGAREKLLFQVLLTEPQFGRLNYVCMHLHFIMSIFIFQLLNTYLHGNKTISTQ